MPRPKTPTPVVQALHRAIQAMGGKSEMARELGTDRRNVHQWTRVPQPYVSAVSRATGIPRHELRPDLFAAPL